MVIRNLMVLGLATALAGSSYAAYTSRLHFWNTTTNNQAAGTVDASVGDNIQIWYHFHASDTVNPFKWGTLRVTLCLDGLSLVSAADEVSWKPQLTAAKASGGPAGDILTTILFDSISDASVMYDNSIDPTDGTSGQPIVCNNGMYVLFGMNGNKTRAHDWDVMLYQFTVAPGSVGNILDWTKDGVVSPTGVNTSILDQAGKTKDITDNRVRVVPEPGSIVAIVTGLAGIAALRRRK